VAARLEGELVALRSRPLVETNQGGQPIRSAGASHMMPLAALREALGIMLAARQRLPVYGGVRCEA
jgi:hypothetical protein